MAFLKIDTLELGMTYGYTATQKSLDKKIRMSSGKLVTEIIGKKWEIKVTYKYLTETQRASLYSILGSIPADGVEVVFYNPSGDLVSGFFTIRDIPSPKVVKFIDNVPSEWADVGFTLEEV